MSDVIKFRYWKDIYSPMLHFVAILLCCDIDQFEWFDINSPQIKNTRSFFFFDINFICFFFSVFNEYVLLHDIKNYSF